MRCSTGQTADDIYISLTKSADILQALHILYTIFVTIASVFGLGRLSGDVGNLDIYFEAVKYEIFSQFAGIMVIGIGKCAVGMFLLRIIRNKIQIAFIRICLVITVIITLFASIVVIVQCSPVKRSWDRRVEGTCWINFSNIGYTVGCGFAGCGCGCCI
jgi:hypothetical protein